MYMCVDVIQGRKKQFIHPPLAWQGSRSTVGLNEATLQPRISVEQNNT